MAGEEVGFAVAVGVGEGVLVEPPTGDAAGEGEGLVVSAAIEAGEGEGLVARPVIADSVIIIDDELDDARMLSVSFKPTICVCWSNETVAVPVFLALNFILTNVPVPVFGSVGCEPMVIDALPAVLFIVLGTSTIGKNVPAVKESICSKAGE